MRRRENSNSSQKKYARTQATIVKNRSRESRWRKSGKFKTTCLPQRKRNCARRAVPKGKNLIKQRAPAKEERNPPNIRPI